MQMRGDVTLVASISLARGLNKGKGYSFKYVRDVLKERRTNAEVTAIHNEVIAMRTPKRSRNPKRK